MYIQFFFLLCLNKTWIWREKLFKCNLFNYKLEYINHFQWDTCNIIFPVPEETKFELDTEKFKWLNIPHCKDWGSILRPNILMFSDYSWIEDRTSKQQDNFEEFLNEFNDKGITILEFGAGTEVPTIRVVGEQVFQNSKGRRTFVRINPEPDIVSQFGKSYDVINDSNIESLKDANENEFIELKLPSLAAIELISKAFEAL